MNKPSEPTICGQPPLHPTPTCCACILHEGRLLMIQRGTEPDQGLWSFPGGRLELGETVFEAVIREVREETNLEVDPLELFQVYDWITRDGEGRVLFHYLVNYVRARHLSGDPEARDDALQNRWVTADDLASLEMHSFVRQTALRLLREAG